MASVTRVTAADEPAFAAALAAHCGQPGVGVLVLFTGAGSPSWCGDCTDAKPVIEAALAQADAPVVLVTVPLVRDEYKGNAAHWARVHPAVKLQKIPTLLRWAANGKRPVNSLVEGQCKVAGDVLELVNSSD